MWEVRESIGRFIGPSANALSLIDAKSEIGDYRNLEIGQSYIIEGSYSPIPGFSFYKLKGIKGWFPAPSFKARREISFRIPSYE